MNRSRALCCFCFVAFLTIAETYQKYQPQKVCAYSSSWSTASCSDVVLSCENNTHIEIWNAVCGARKSFDNSCIPNIFRSKCYSQTNCCRKMTGDIRWPMTVQHQNRLGQACSGKNQCHFKAPVRLELVTYNTHYCYILYRCTDEPVSASTATSSITTTTTSQPGSLATSRISVNPGMHGTKRYIVTHATTFDTAPGDSPALPLSATASKPGSLTTFEVNPNPGMHGTKRHIVIHATTVAIALGDSSDLQLPAVIGPVVIATVGIVLGIIFVRRRRQKQRGHESVAMGAIDQLTIDRASDQYETMPQSTEGQSHTYEKCNHYEAISPCTEEQRHTYEKCDQYETLSSSTDEQNHTYEKCEM